MKLLTAILTFLTITLLLGATVTAQAKCIPEGDTCQADYQVNARYGYCITTPNLTDGQGKGPTPGPNACKKCEICSITVCWDYDGLHVYLVVWNDGNSTIGGTGSANGTWIIGPDCNEEDSPPDIFAEIDHEAPFGLLGRFTGTASCACQKGK